MDYITKQHLAVVSQIFEVDDGKWIYRFIAEDTGVLVKRTPSDTPYPLWSHSIRTEMVSESTEKFESATAIRGFSTDPSRHKRFSDLAEALVFVNSNTKSESNYAFSREIEVG